MNALAPNPWPQSDTIATRVTLTVESRGPELVRPCYWWRRRESNPRPVRCASAPCPPSTALLPLVAGFQAHYLPVPHRIDTRDGDGLEAASGFPDEGYARQVEASE